MHQRVFLYGPRLLASGFATKVATVFYGPHMVGDAGLHGWRHALEQRLRYRRLLRKSRLHRPRLHQSFPVIDVEPAACNPSSPMSQSGTTTAGARRLPAGH